MGIIYIYIYINYSLCLAISDLATFFFFFFLRVLTYSVTKTSIGFLCRQGLNPKFFIQLSDTLLVKLIETYYVIL